KRSASIRTGGSHRAGSEVARTIRGSPNGRTTDSGSVYLGSNASPRIHFRFSSHLDRSHCLFGSWPHRLAVRTSASHAGNASSSLAGVTRRERNTRPPSWRAFVFRLHDPADGLGPHDPPAVVLRA